MSVGKNLLVEGKQWLMRGGSSASLSRVSEGKTKWCAGNSCTPGPGDRREHREESSRGSSPSKTRRPRIWPLVAGCDEDGLFVERGSHFFFQSATPASGVCRWLCNPGRKELPHKVRYHSGECSAVGSNVRPHRSSFLLLVTVDGRVTEECPFDKAKNPTSERWITRLASR